MLKVAICDDVCEYIKKLESYIEQYGKENCIQVKTNSYVGGEHLLLTYIPKKYDIIFLDISMPTMDGFETAKRIREMDKDVVIVFCTSYYTITNAQRGFEVEAKDFLKKPVYYKKIESVLNKVYSKKLTNAREKFILKNQDGLFSIQISDIIYLEAKNKAVVIHTSQGNLVSYQKIYEFEEKLGGDLFYRCHNSYLVNLEYVERMQDTKLVLRDNCKTMLPVSKYRKEQFLKHLAKHIGNQIN